MPYKRWIVQQEISRRRKAVRDQVFRRAERVINHQETQQKPLSEFPAVSSYLKSRFADVDLSQIQIYVAPAKVVEKSGFKNIGGCYVRGMKSIIVKDEIDHAYKPKGKFQKLMREVCHMKTDVEDVLVHECIHAVSDLIDRALSYYQHMEEEFVYTNCIEFYYEKGMSDEDIVNNNFLPFCLQDVYESPNEMKVIFDEVGKSIADLRQMSEEEYWRFLNSNAETLVPLLKKRAQEKAHNMIELYRKYGSMHKTSSTEVVEDESVARFSSLDLD